jgi:hypothetical protein
MLCAFGFAGDKRCEEAVFDEDAAAIYSCFYPAQTILEAYADFRESRIQESPDDPGYKNLRVKLEIGKNHKYADDDVEIQYTWNNDKALVVNIYYAGGETDAEFTREPDGTRSIVTFSPD